MSLQPPGLGGGGPSLWFEGCAAQDLGYELGSRHVLSSDQKNEQHPKPLPHQAANDGFAAALDPKPYESMSVQACLGLRLWVFRIQDSAVHGIRKFRTVSRFRACLFCCVLLGRRVRTPASNSKEVQGFGGYTLRACCFLGCHVNRETCETEPEAISLEVPCSQWFTRES